MRDFVAQAFIGRAQRMGWRLKRYMHQYGNQWHGEFMLVREFLFPVIALHC